MNNINEIVKLPDYSIVKKLAKSLWQQDTSYHGVAIMIGAGFSRSSATSGDLNKKLPLWSDLSLKLTEQLQDSYSLDPLRLAEIYSAYHGKQSLRDLIQKEINNDSWSPGGLYKSLLTLPWSEVLTTNWDTLLERAAKNINYPVYNIVYKKEDLSNARSPRIVKLHGTIGVTEDLIFTEEDFRTYPTKYAAFVNFARQVFIENELCLLGFSGDDPNFLQWAGWVRDHLQSHSRRIYLVGALNLTNSKRKYLENINIQPIDLYPLVSHFDESDKRHQEAIKVFLQTLMNLKPKQVADWSPTTLVRKTTTSEEQDKVWNDAAYAASLLEKQIPILEKDRISYPNWLVCPDSIRFSFHTQISDPYPIKKNLLQLSPDSRAKLLYEIAWRHNVTYSVLDESLIDEFLLVCDPDKPCILKKKEQMEIALVLLKNSRWQTDIEKKSSIQQKMEYILKKNNKYWSESLAELSYFQAIEALYKLDYSTIENLIHNIKGIDPVWKLRKAYLLAELARYEESSSLIEQTYNELLTQYRNDKHSIYIYSRLAWAHWLIRNAQYLKLDEEFERFPLIYKEKKCDPYDIIKSLEEKIQKKLNEKHKPNIEPAFEVGTYKDHSNTITFSNEIHPALLFNGISDIVGIPIHLQHVSLLRITASDLTYLLELDDWQKFSLIIRTATSETSKVIQHTFSRINLAKMPQDIVIKLIDTCFDAINYWKEVYLSNNDEKNMTAITRLRVLFEVVARLQICTPTNTVKRVFKLAISVGLNEKMRFFWLYDSISHLIEYAFESIPTSEHHELLLDVLNFPLCDDEKWPNPIINFPGERKKNNEIDFIINKLIETINFKSSEKITEDNDVPNDTKSFKCLLRILPLIKAGYISDEENNALAQAIYGNNFDFEKLPSIGLLPHAFFNILPSKDIDKMHKLISRTIFKFRFKPSFQQNTIEQTRIALLSIVTAARNDTNSIFLPPDLAIQHFDSLVEWRMPHETNHGLLGTSFLNVRNNAVFKLIGQAFSYAIIPVIPIEQLNETRFNQLYQFYSQISSYDCIIAFTYFTKSQPFLCEKVERIIAKNLMSLEPGAVKYAANAIFVWRGFSTSKEVLRLIQRLCYLVVSGRKTGLPSLLNVINKMYKNDWLIQENTSLLIDSIPIIFDDYNYNRDYYSEDIINIFDIRRECVRLAKTILDKLPSKDKELERILTEAKNDPMPEVRFADIEKN